MPFLFNPCSPCCDTYHPMISTILRSTGVGPQLGWKIVDLNFVDETTPVEVSVDLMFQFSFFKSRKGMPQAPTQHRRTHTFDFTFMMSDFPGVVAETDYQFLISLGAVCWVEDEVYISFLAGSLADPSPNLLTIVNPAPGDDTTLETVFPDSLTGFHKIQIDSGQVTYNWFNSHPDDSPLGEVEFAFPMPYTLPANADGFTKAAASSLRWDKDDSLFYMTLAYPYSVAGMDIGLDNVMPPLWITMDESGNLIQSIFTNLAVFNSSIRHTNMCMFDNDTVMHIGRISTNANGIAFTEPQVYFYDKTGTVISLDSIPGSRGLPFMDPTIECNDEILVMNFRQTTPTAQQISDCFAYQKTDVEVGIYGEANWIFLKTLDRLLNGQVLLADSSFQKVWS